MTHEFKKLVLKGKEWQGQNLLMVLATVVDLEGSSYRRPGVRMLINERGDSCGAVSGGCVEKEIIHQASHVLRSRESYLMTYDGRLRLGCEGIVYILLEPFFIEDAFAKAFETALQERLTFNCTTYFDRKLCNQGTSKRMGSLVRIKEQDFKFAEAINSIDRSLDSYKQECVPLFQLYVFGAEHDAVTLTRMAAQLGWEVTVIASPDEEKSIDYFEGANRLLTPTIDTLDTNGIDGNTAILLMTHSFAKDVQYLLRLTDCSPAYLGILGPQHRRERVFDEFLERFPETDPDYLERIYGPAGINLGAESAAEIAISIIAEILAVIRNQNPISLREKKGTIHE